MSAQPDAPARVDVEEALRGTVAALDAEALVAAYQSNDRFLFLESFLPEPVLSAWREELEVLRPLVHRNYIPRHKRGGSVDYGNLAHAAPTIAAVYTSPTFRAFVQRIVGEPVELCPPSDLHACALYAYTQPGDHMGFHYDNSYYRGRRYTVLLGLVNAASCRLVCRLHTKNPDRDEKTLELETTPGALVLFDGDRMLHKVTPLAAGEERHAITMQYVTNGDMNPFLRFVSNMKDAIAYFGFRKVFGKRKLDP